MLTTGLDPQARHAIWGVSARHPRAGQDGTILTTHLMEEAERLCDRVAIIEYGRIIDVDTPAALVARHCAERTVILSTVDPRAEGHFRAMAHLTDLLHEESRFPRSVGLVTASSPT